MKLLSFNWHRLAAPAVFVGLASRLIPWLAGLCLILMGIGLYGGLVLAPPDYQQGDAFRIIYVHVPAAWLSLMIYMVMAACSVVVLVWRIKLMEYWVVESAVIGAAFTLIALVTGSIWGKPMWGTWWVWDARLTSELILLFIYLGIISLYQTINDPRAAARAAALLTLVGVVNIPIIHYSVIWWNTLHQGPTVTKFANPSIHIDMLIPLLIMALAFKVFYFTLALMRVRNAVLTAELSKGWIKQFVEGKT